MAPMKVSGFTFIRNAEQFDYPVVEAIRSILPLCDEVVVAVGDSADKTREIIAKIDPKIRIIDTVWDDSLREGGAVLAVETNKAFHACAADSDWCFYIQGDEVFPEYYLDTVQRAMLFFKDDKRVEGFLFNYHHFYGSYDYVGASNAWYAEEIRIIRNDRNIYSYKDAQGFRINSNEKLKVVKLPVWMHHYGWVKDPRAMQEKQETFNKLWHDDEWMEKNVVKKDAFSYEQHMKQLTRFKGQHPKVMEPRIQRLNWHFDVDVSIQKRTLKDILKDVLLTIGINPNYQNYKLIGRWKEK
jgi:glycosyltransferase involved in cell wall biosynthesis